MKAVLFHTHGGADVLRYEEAPDPILREDEVLVRVRACALNHLDLWVRRGLPGIKVPLPHIGGSDISGEVAAVGSLVTRCKERDRVVLSPGISCGQCQACFQGQDSLCRKYTIHGYMVDGGYAELVRTPASCVIPIPDHLDFITAAAAPLVFLTAWHMLVTRAALRVGEKVLVLAAGSGVGQAAVQIAKLLGAQVMATAGTDEKIEGAQALGADEVVNHRTGSILEKVRHWTAGRGVDVVFEHVGEATFEQSFKSLAAGGRWVTCGATTGYAAQLDLRHLFSKQITLLGSYMGGKGELLEVLKFVFSGQLKPVIDRVFPLSEARAAQERMESSSHFGKIVLAV